MNPPEPGRAGSVRFADFVVDLDAGEVHRGAVKVPLQEKPFQLLAALAERPGRIVTREELRLRLWDPETFVDFDNNLNAAAKKLRDALGDSAESPRFVETGDFAALLAYSPLHNLEAGRCYPPVLTVVAGEDTSTTPMHGYKFTAALQAAQGCGRPVMIKSIPGVGHYSYGSEHAEISRNQAEVVAFLAEAVGLGVGEPDGP